MIRDLFSMGWFERGPKSINTATDEVLSQIKRILPYQEMGLVAALPVY